MALQEPVSCKKYQKETLSFLPPPTYLVEKTSSEEWLASKEQKVHVHSFCVPVSVWRCIVLWLSKSAQQSIWAPLDVWLKPGYLGKAGCWVSFCFLWLEFKCRSDYFEVELRFFRYWGRSLVFCTWVCSLQNYTTIAHAHFIHEATLSPNVRFQGSLLATSIFCTLLVLALIYRGNREHSCVIIYLTAISALVIECTYRIFETWPF